MQTDDQQSLSPEGRYVVKADMMRGLPAIRLMSGMSYFLPLSQILTQVNAAGGVSCKVIQNIGVFLDQFSHNSIAGVMS
jgi:hypothetical protein